MFKPQGNIAAGNPQEEAQRHQTMIVDAMGFCYLIVPYGQAVDSNLGQAQRCYNNIYRASLLLHSHHDGWGRRFNLRKLYARLLNPALLHHKSDKELGNELSARIACGELQVYRVGNLLTP
ncbi:hypothetical protein C9I98_16015 [Photobacterium sanctipauli]|uniref:Uncharacterized protein n=1 Tax=Photobacterium sanctipauli TaxID=1342794 RepID=A0A2T3NQM4_9GAMM|nr:hypothetical protein [Photobacterium sanctipauli]PSW18570.1 hypothetical protein C9I98_16015 [Photobacterium sanctipauli]